MPPVPKSAGFVRSPSRNTLSANGMARAKASANAVRIASARETKDGTHYDIRYMAYGPGEHDIARLQGSVF